MKYHSISLNLTTTRLQRLHLVLLLTSEILARVLIFEGRDWLTRRRAAWPLQSCRSYRFHLFLKKEREKEVAGKVQGKRLWGCHSWTPIHFHKHLILCSSCRITLNYPTALFCGASRELKEQGIWEERESALNETPISNLFMQCLPRAVVFNSRGRQLMKGCLWGFFLASALQNAPVSLRQTHQLFFFCAFPLLFLPLSCQGCCK